MLAIAILAAGKGTRMRSNLPKVLHQLAGKSLIERVLTNCKAMNANHQFLIVGHKSEDIKKTLSENTKLEFVLQEPQNGTGHAIQQLTPFLNGFKGDLLVLNGDVPLLRESTIKSLLETHRSQCADATLLTARIKNPFGYGRVFLKDDKKVEKIVEEKDCNTNQRKNTLTNGGVYCFNWEKLSKIISKLSSSNNQNEIYLTEAISKLEVTIHHEVDDSKELSGINNKRQLADCESILQERLRDYWLEEGVTFTDPTSCTISEDCDFGNNVIIEPQTHFRGKCKVGDNCIIGPGSLIKDSQIGNDVNIINSVINSSKIENKVVIGPFAHIRPDVHIKNNCKIGNFVEIKKSTIGVKTKVNHLSYIGDTICGENVNVGAGTITANFDGIRKHSTIIGNHCKTGANSVLVAPIQLEDNVTVGAGSTLTKNIPKGALAISRSKQSIKDNWKKS